MADPDLELRGSGLDLLALLAFFTFVISSILPKIRGEGEGGAPGPSSRSATDVSKRTIGLLLLLLFNIDSIDQNTVIKVT